MSEREQIVSLAIPAEATEISVVVTYRKPPVGEMVTVKIVKKESNDSAVPEQDWGWV